MIKHVKKYLIAHEGNSYKPHLLREKSLTAIAVLIFVLFCTSLGSSYLINKTDFGAAVLPAVLVDLTNEHRLANNGKALAINTTLEKAASMKAKDMAENQYFAHTSPTGVTPWYWFSKAGYKFVYAGENLAINFTESLDVERAWIASPTHQANLISEKFDETGIATYQGTYQGKPTIFVVQLFGKSAKPRPVTTVTKEVQSPVSEPEKLAQEDTKAPEVKGESVAIVEQASVDPEEPAPVLLVQEPTFSVAQNLNETEPEQEASFTAPKYSTLAERLLVNQAKYVQYVYLGLIILIYFVLIGMIVTEFKIQHVKNISLAVLLLCLLGALAYINSSFVLSFV
ncbi:MAG: CAP domain-containing protein [Candidatus Pacebacteria bacterium]|nr:CAP domain-containing protein [Candidatus Paceibacterota bacterium]